MIALKKTQTGGNGLSKKLYQYDNNINIDYLGVSEKLPTEREILEGYEITRQFFLDREKYHQEVATWYYNHACDMEAKAGQHLDKAERAYQQARDYLYLDTAFAMSIRSAPPRKSGPIAATWTTIRTCGSTPMSGQTAKSTPTSAVERLTPSTVSSC